jgi:predicted sulfurtransferase
LPQRVVQRLDFDGDGSLGFGDVTHVASGVVEHLDEAMVALEDWNKGKYWCEDCGKSLKKKSKYATNVCVDCSRNPSDEKRCIAPVSSGDRCKRRKSSDSEIGYCGIHMRKHSEPLPLTE